MHSIKCVISARYSWFRSKSLNSTTSDTFSKSQLAYDIIREKLSDGEWRRKKWIVQKVESVVDVSDATIKRVAKELNIESRRTSETPSETEWRIPQSAHKRKQ